GVALSGLISAVNSRGTAKMVISYILASVLIIASVFVTVDHYVGLKGSAAEQARLAAEQERQKILAEQKAKEMEEKAEEIDEFKEKALEISEKANKIARSIAYFNPDRITDEQWDLSERSSRGYISMARAYKKEAGELENVGESTREILEKLNESLDMLSRAASSHKSYFMSESESQEWSRRKAAKDAAITAKNGFEKVIESCQTKKS
ncbi:MAG: hypothetical protein ACLFQK_08130, partial [Fibrobacterota bacterium]